MHNRKLFVILVAACALSYGLAQNVYAQYGDKEAKKKHDHDHDHDHDDDHDHDHEGEMAMDPAMMAQMMENMMPGEHHAHLKPLEGEWAYKSTFTMMPGAPPSETKGTCTRKWLMDGRYLEEKIEGEGFMPNTKFIGYGITGYDNTSKKYVSTWIDNMGTGIMFSEGACDQSGKVFTFNWEGKDCMTGQDTQIKSVIRIVNNDKHVFEMHQRQEDGSMHKNMEITFTRK